MAEDTTRTSNRRLNSGASEYNAISFLCEQMIKGMVNTAIPVRVDSCTKPGVGGAAGYVSATPLVKQRGADGKSLDPVSLPQLPYFRLQCGTAAVVLDPQPGDIGLAICSQQDSSNVQAGTSSPVQAGSFRCFDMSDSFYVGGFMNQTPETYIHLDPEKGEITVKSPTKITLESPTIELKGALQMGNSSGSGSGDTISLTGNIQATGSATFDGNIRSNGSITAPDIHQD
jgi:hypothetical protein